MVFSPNKKLSTFDIARLLGVAVSSISKWIDEGTLVAGRTPGGHRRIEQADFVRFLRQQKLKIPAELEEPSPSKVLIVDDERQFAQWLAEEIKGRFPDCEVSMAFDGYSAGEIIGLTKPEVVILDLHMPGIDGFEVCRRIKSNPLLKDTCVIGVTADFSPEVRSRILEIGACICLIKPFDLNVLIGELSKQLARPI